MLIAASNTTIGRTDASTNNDVPIYQVYVAVCLIALIADRFRYSHSTSSLSRWAHRAFSHESISRRGRVFDWGGGRASVLTRRGQKSKRKNSCARLVSKKKKKRREEREKKKKKSYRLLRCVVRRRPVSDRCSPRFGTAATGFVTVAE